MNPNLFGIEDERGMINNLFDEWNKFYEKPENIFPTNTSPSCDNTPLMETDETPKKVDVNNFLIDLNGCLDCGVEYETPLDLCKCSPPTVTLASVNLPWHKQLSAQIDRLSDNPEKLRKYYAKTLEQLVDDIL